ncbi:tRNA (N6-threonylcarbamoyladenosine(37)-N6)-methyltransferase TrmO [Rubritalea marina]|uniref:tRNA (N6-threonylcarbamoyladenosine(37)-N6)-methyltransferase TrmO n=1 Tax=Rubritalea marina TaxID=361055 RepID=UPI00047552C1|nr:tRNA (N6-threonylcarbamoyladenosine(37)-N6)-methyltransferase TrmO [Rubritalea marina]
MDRELKQIGTIRTCYREKFGVPRQPRLVEEAWGWIEFDGEFNDPSYVRGLEAFSHIWLLFQFHQADEQRISPTVRPPRLGGNQRMGVFATRAPYRPNRIGMSVVELERVEISAETGVRLKVKGVDIVSGTPILDIKPYVPFSDSVPEAVGGFVSGEPERLELEWRCEAPSDSRHRSVIEGSLSLDPRPAYQGADAREYGSAIAGWDLRWKVESGVLYVLSAECSGSFDS